MAIILWQNTKSKNKDKQMKRSTWNLFIVLLIVIALGMIFVEYSNSTGLDEFNKSFSPPDPLTSYHYKDESNWTAWNKVLFSSAVGLYGVGDTVASVGADSRGCVESNPLFGEHPSAGLLILGKTAMLGASWYLTEYILEGDPNQQNYRNFLYGLFTLVGGYATYHNATVECY